MKNIIYSMMLLFPVWGFSQTITGKVTNQKNEPLNAATVTWLGTDKSVTTDENGVFTIEQENINLKKLVAAHVYHLPDTIEVTDQTEILFILKPFEKLEEVTVSSYLDGIIISNKTPIKVERITQAELRKSACCDLAGCFETQLTVQPQTTNVITNSKELRILGLSGVYNQVLVDGLPMIQGLTYTYGISSIPGAIVENIYVSKGANSVIQGFESISGQINVETKKPDHTDKLFLNLYMNSFLEKHFNANITFNAGKWKNLTAFHTVQAANRVDNDKDDFLDLPLLTRYLLHTKWKYGNEAEWGWSNTTTLRYFNENRLGGQTTFYKNKHKGSTTVYGQDINIQQPELMTKLNYRMNDAHSFAFYTSAFHQNQESFFGTVKYDARQTNFYTNLQHELTYNQHELKTGVSFRRLNIEENISFTESVLGRTYGGNYLRKESIPGIFAENTMRFLDEKITWIAGIRADFHNEFGTKITPRTLVKYNITPSSTIRANVGAGWRTVNLFSENIQLLSSSRDIIFTEALQPERAINAGINFTQNLQGENNNFSGTITVDFYTTRFQNQIFPDYDTDPTKAYIKNFTGKSVSNGLQAEIFLKLWQRIELKTGYNYLDVFQEKENKRIELPFNPRHKVLSTFTYKPLSNKYHFDFNFHWYGQQRLPDTKTNPIAYQRPDYSDPYTTMNAQFTYNFNKVEVYIGCENIFNFRQTHPIISWQNPFSPYFDTSSVWGPTRGREGYVGVRFKLKQQ